MMGYRASPTYDGNFDYLDALIDGARRCGHRDVREALSEAILLEAVADVRRGRAVVGQDNEADLCPARRGTTQQSQAPRIVVQVLEGAGGDPEGGCDGVCIAADEDDLLCRPHLLEVQALQRNRGLEDSPLGGLRGEPVQRLEAVLLHLLRHALVILGKLPKLALLADHRVLIQGVVGAGRGLADLAVENARALPAVAVHLVAATGVRKHELLACR
mmetsp:Transcript_73167/g.214439  ORF Transcript_73167/g.214439 Transcript_73167/m.214439 type:complete len:216 (-) Transcript_73167:1045-1692(-)